jgi:ParB-like chromosome segregation protein Spo0J
MKTKSISYDGRVYEFSVEAEGLTIPADELLNLPKGLLVIVYFLATTKMCWLERGTFKGVYSATKHWVAPKMGGLSLAGSQEFGTDSEVVDMAQKHREHLQSKMTPAQPASDESPEAERGPDVENPATEAPPISPASSEESDEPEQMLLSKIMKNPLNNKLYDPGVDPGLLASVNQFGVLVPIRITRDYLIVDGHQRYEASVECGYRLIPAIYVDVPEDKLMQAILNYNSGRHHSLVERIRMYREHLQIERAEASERAGTRTDLEANLSPGDVTFGKARDFAAMKVKLSGTSAETGLKVLEQIERHESEGKTENIQKVKDALNKSINGAYKFALALGWLDTAVKPRSRKKPSDETKETTGAADQSMTEVAEGQEPSASSWLHDQAIDASIRKARVPTNKRQAIMEAIAEMRPAIYVLAGTQPSKNGAIELRTLARVLLSLVEQAEREANTKRRTS